MSQPIGQSLKGYLIQEFIQAGGFGSVYKAYQDAIRRDVAIKIINNEIVQNAEFIRRFEIEARIVAKLEHPHIVPLYDFWREPERAYLVMRWLPGGSLRDMLTMGKTLNPEMLIRLVTQLGSALEFVHQHGVVHRDIKPENLLTDQMGNFYLTDFGIAIDIMDRSVDNSAILNVGSPEYMSPEQILNNAVTYRSDIYTFAVMLYELLTFHLPFSGNSIDEILMQHVNTPFPSVQQFRPDLPADIDDIFAKATHKSPQLRYASVIAFVNELLPYLSISGDISADVLRALAPTKSKSPHEHKTGDYTDTLIFARKAEETRNPYKGLYAFDETDSSDFYGREAILYQLIECLEGKHGSIQQRFIGLIGPSGSGKSSVIRAGLIPKLRSGAIPGSEDWFYIMMTPGDDPFRNLAEKINSISIRRQDDLSQRLQVRTNAIDIILAELLPPKAHLVLFIDQFEEVFTLVESESMCRAFLDLLTNAMQSLSNLTLILTLRADFYDKPLAYSVFGKLIQESTIVLLPLSTEELTSVIEGPAESVGLQIQVGLLSQLVADTIDQPNALPLLQFTLTELFDHREEDVLTLRAYHEMGGIDTSIAKRAEQLYSSLNESYQEGIRRLFLQLIVISDSGKPVRQRILWQDALSIMPTREQVESIINLYGESRLLTFDRDSSTRTPTIELAHEALIRSWKRLQDWIEDNKSDLLTFHRLSNRAKEWSDKAQESSYLARDAELFQYTQLANKSLITFTTLEQEFVHSSQQLRKRSQQRRAGVIVSLVILTLASIFMAIIALDRQYQADLAKDDALVQRDRANSEAEIAQSRTLAATALSSIEQGDLAIMLAVESLIMADTFEGHDSLLQVLESQSAILGYMHADSPIRAITHFGNLLITGDDVGRLGQWDLSSHVSLMLSDSDVLSSVNALAISDDGNLIAAGGMGGAIVIDRQSGKSTAQLRTTSDQEIWGIAFGADKIIYMIDASGLLYAWDQASDSLLYEKQISSQALFGIAMHPLKTQIAIAGADNTIYVVNVTTGEIDYSFEGHSNWILTLAFSPDGTILASAGADLNVIVWNMKTFEAIGQIPTGHSDWIRQLAFDPQGKFILTASADATIRLWDIATGNRVGDMISAHNSPVWAGIFVSDDEIVTADIAGQIIHTSIAEIQFPMLELREQDYEIVDAETSYGQIAIAGAPSGNNTTGIIDIVDSQSLESVQRLQVDSFITDLEYSPDGKWLAIAGIDQSVRLYQTSDYSAVYDPIGTQASIVLSLAFSPDSQYLVSADDAGWFYRWNMLNGEAVAEPLQSGHIGILDLAFSTDSKIFASAGREGNIRLWDAKTFQPIGDTFFAHENGVTGMLFSKDTKTLISFGRDSLVKIWDVETQSLVSTLPKIHNDWILDATLMDDEKYLISIGRDKVLVIWDLDRRQTVGGPISIKSTDWGIALIQNEQSGNTYSFHRDGKIISWQLEISQWLDHACKVANFSQIQQEILHLTTNLVTTQGRIKGCPSKAS